MRPKTLIGCDDPLPVPPIVFVPVVLPQGSERAESRYRPYVMSSPPLLILRRVGSIADVRPPPSEMLYGSVLLQRGLTWPLPSTAAARTPFEPKLTRVALIVQVLTMVALADVEVLV